MVERAYMASSKSTEWQTPKDLFDALWEEFGGFDLDPCGQREHHYTAWKITSRGGACYDGSTLALDGLTQPWIGKVFCNPPYGRGIRHWVAKAVAELRDGHARTVVALLPVRTDTAWWQSFVVSRVHRELPPAGEIDAPYQLREVRFLPGRLKFRGAESGPAPFPSAIVVWDVAPLAPRTAPAGQAKLEGV